MRASFNGFEIQLVDLVVGAEDFERNLAKNGLKTAVDFGGIGGVAKHGESSVTATSYPDHLRI